MTTLVGPLAKRLRWSVIRPINVTVRLQCGVRGVGSKAADWLTRDEVFKAQRRRMSVRQLGDGRMRTEKRRSG
jgi:hypothetical protein